MKNVFVGEDIILPRSLRSQNAHPYVAKTKNLYLVRRGDLRSPAISVTDFLLKAVILSKRRDIGRDKDNMA